MILWAIAVNPNKILDNEMKEKASLQKATSKVFLTISHETLPIG